MTKKVKRQPKVKGGRHRMYPHVDATTEYEIERLCNIYGVSRSWVMNTIFADACKVKTHVRYYDVVKPHNIRRVK